MAGEIVKSEDVSSTELSLTGGTGQVVSSVDTKTPEGKLRLFGALQDSEKIDEHLNEVINLKDVVFQSAQVTDEDTGEVSDVVRTILIDDKGRAFSATSGPLVSSLKTMFSILGDPTSWESPIAIKVSEKKSRRGYRFYQVTPVVGK